MGAVELHASSMGVNGRPTCTSNTFSGEIRAVYLYHLGQTGSYSESTAESTRSDFWISSSLTVVFRTLADTVGYSKSTLPVNYSRVRPQRRPCFWCEW